ncbi:methyltransferase domain-containing protein [Mycetocola manganoxydans]|uniref:Methyltransferase domain-containing protein n=1 Tax=Mycetocola manganoxydans TaxID=699879 RepID=A0A3L6ZPA9_9MICO|nr:methyltransferase [Mycetocola manganoxydans]RLP69763.1 methyltransferase domain-containing protein [Mycetocola manganoxydans]GHD49953.1 16S RNA G1207 methylase RsmC [Mycetocola manganoxydans]
MASEHYFTGVPGTELKLRTVTVHLAGEERELTTANGIFSPARIDQGTQVLLSETPRPPATGNILDLGCGWGPIAFTIAFASPDATVWAVDVNERSLELVRMNAEKLGLTNVKAVLPDQVPGGLLFDSIWSNPPIRIGKQALHEMLEHWLPRLTPGSDAWLVVQKNLGADSLHRWLQEQFGSDLDVTREAISKGYRVLRASRHAD